MLANSKQFLPVTLINRLGQAVAVELFYHRDSSTDLVVFRAADALESRHLAKNIEHFAHQLLGLCESTPERLYLIEWREAEAQHSLWRWRFNWVGNSPLDAKALAISKASQHKYINGLLSSLTVAAA